MTALAPAPAPGWAAAWGAALDELELDVDRAEALLGAVHAGQQLAAEPARPWAPPSNLGPLPESLLERAQRVHARQLQVSADIAHAVVRSRRDLDLANRLEGASAPSRPLFVDAAF